MWMNIRLLIFSVFLMAITSNCTSSQSQSSIIEEAVTFRAAEVTLNGTLRIPETNTPVPLLILYHAASGGSSDFPFYEHLKTDLPNRGIATFIYDRRGTNGQPGDFETASFKDLARDGIAAAKVLATNPRIDSKRIGAWGISQGGWVSPLAANLSEELSFAISVSGPGVSPARQMAFTSEYHLREAGYPDEIVDTALDLRARMDAYFRAPNNREELQSKIDSHRDAEWFSLAFLPNGGYLPDDITQSKWYHEMDFDPTVTLSELDDPFLVIFGSKDRWVPVTESVAAYRGGLNDQSLLTVYVSEKSGHLMSGEDETSEYNGELPVETEYIDVMVDWIEGLTAQ